MKALTTCLFLLSACGTDVHVLDGTDAGELRLDAGIGRDGASSGEDGGPPIDAAATDGEFYRLRVLGFDFDEIHVEPETCDSYEGVGKRLEVTLELRSSCEEPGPVEVRIDAASREIQISGFVWELIGPTDCVPEARTHTESVFVDGLSSGTWTVGSATGSHTIEVGGPPPPITCVEPGPVGASCLADCDCLEGRCVEAVNDAVCGARTCQRICNAWLDAPGFHPECPPGLACAPDPVFGNTCQNPARDLCTGPADCPPATECAADSDFASHCIWRSDWRGVGVLRPCSRNSDCDPGLDCVERPEHAKDPRLARGTCDIRCRTADQTCPSEMRCAMAGRPVDPRWVCGWETE